jgi:hypothetical protein
VRSSPARCLHALCAVGEPPSQARPQPAQGRRALKAQCPELPPPRIGGRRPPAPRASRAKSTGGTRAVAPSATSLPVILWLAYCFERQAQLLDRLGPGRLRRLFQIQGPWRTTSNRGSAEPFSYLISAAPRSQRVGGRAVRHESVTEGMTVAARGHCALAADPYGDPRLRTCVRRNYARLRTELTTQPSVLPSPCERARCAGAARLR